MHEGEAYNIISVCAHILHCSDLHEGLVEFCDPTEVRNYRENSTCGCIKFSICLRMPVLLHGARYLCIEVIIFIIHTLN